MILNRINHKEYSICVLKNTTADFFFFLNKKYYLVSNNNIYIYIWKERFLHYKKEQLERILKDKATGSSIF